MESLIVLSGAVCSISRHEQTARFNLRTGEGVFSIHLDRQLTDLLDRVLRPSVQVCVIGSPRSYYHRRRRTNLVFVEALVFKKATQADLYFLARQSKNNIQPC